MTEIVKQRGGAVMFGKKKPTQEYLDSSLCWAAYRGKARRVKNLLAAGANVHANQDDALHSAVCSGDVETMKVLLEAGADVHQGQDWALWRAQIRHDTEALKVVREAINRQDNQRERERRELEQQRNPLRVGTGLTFAKFGPGDMDALLREAVAEQEQMQYTARPRAPGRDYVLLPRL